jgi:hypothetical protein
VRLFFAGDTCGSSGAEINDGIFALVLERFERGIAASQRLECKRYWHLAL